jgi:hypothetical protein
METLNMFRHKMVIAVPAALLALIAVSSTPADAPARPHGPVTQQPPVPLIEVDEAYFATGVGKDMEIIRPPFGPTAQQGPLYLWTRIKGSTKALAILEAAGKLPINHSWYYFPGGVYGGREDAIQTDAIDLSDSRADKIKALRLELAQRTFFDWRTWSMKEHVHRGYWAVTLMYADGDPVRCGYRNVECTFRIEVK